MKRFFTPNITRAGRVARFVCGLVLLVAGLIAFPRLWWLGMIFFGSAVFVFFEAARGWCALRACGIKTKL